MKLVTILAAMIFALSAASASVYAQGRGNGQAKKTAGSGPKAKSTVRPAKTAAKAEARAVKAARTNPQREARLLARLPAGTNIHDASQGFKNWGQFVAAVNASNNHNIPFADLKAKMTGIAPGSTVPTTSPMSLGQALQSFKGTTTAPHP